MSVEERLAEAFGSACVEGYLHAIDVDAGAEIRYRSHAPVVLDGRRYAVAVFTRAASATPPAADASIGTAARIAIDHLRS